jgi:Ca2+/Na+ antiporter
LLGNTAEDYFVPSLTTISDYLKLSPNVAGVTLLALGNGAPDLSSIIVSVLGGSTAFGIGAPIGGGLFVCSIVLGIVCFVSDVKVTRRPFLRDSIMYFVSVVFVFILFLKNGIAIYESIICILLYVLYVFIVVMGRFIRQQWNKRFGKSSESEEQEEDGELYGGDWTGGWREFPMFDHQFVDDQEVGGEEEGNIQTEYSNGSDEEEEKDGKTEKTKLLSDERDRAVFLSSYLKENRILEFLYLLLGHLQKLKMNISVSFHQKWMKKSLKKKMKKGN